MRDAFGRFARRRLVLGCFVAAVAAITTACENPGGWYPSGTATLAGSYEYEADGVRSLVVAATVENTGASTIALSTFTIVAETEVRTYWKTVTSDVRVLPGARIAVTGVVAYADVAERLASGGLAIVDAFFE